MELEELKTLIEGDQAKAIDKIKSLAPVIPQEAYDIEPENHKVVKDLTYRPWRDVEEPTGEKDAKGDMIYRPAKKDVHRIPSNTQKTIIEWAVRMSLSGGIDRDYSLRDSVASDQTMADMIDRTWEDNKLDFICQKIERLKKTYTQCLAVWYAVDAEEGFWSDVAPKSSLKMRVSIFSPKDGSISIPIYDQYMDMIACARSYTVKIEDKDVKRMDLYMKDQIITYTEGGDIAPVVVPLKYGKANFIFHGQDRTEFADVQAKIERVEEGDSDGADENQQSSFPILAAIGEIEAAAGGGTKNTRKTFSMKDGGDLKYVEAQGGQKSAIEERKNLRQDIYDETSTPHVSIETITGTGVPTSGVAIEMAFLPATNKAKSNQQGDLGMEWQRHLNFLKSAMAVINIQVKPSVSMMVKPKFKVELPKNRTEEITNIVSLVEAGLMSKKTAIAKLGIVEDVEAEWAAIQEEVKAAAAAAPVVVPPVNA